MEELMPNKISQELRKKIEKPVSKKLIRVRDGGKAGKLSYISGYTVISMLNDMFGYNWDWSIINAFIEEAPADKYGNQGFVAHCLGELVVRVVDENGNIQEIKKQGYGSKKCIGGSENQQHVYKVASTDALKKAASMLGIGAQLYLKEEEVNALAMEAQESPWTPELRKKYEKQWSFINNVAKTYGDDILNAAAEAWSSNSLYDYKYVEPDLIDDFVQYIDKQMQEA